MGRSTVATAVAVIPTGATVALAEAGIRFTIAVAPLPPPPTILTTGSAVYPTPGVVKGIAKTCPFKMVGTPATAIDFGGEGTKLGIGIPDQTVRLEP
jgi:hypothetical protein